jgi:SAM-dependent methyltransferase
MVLGGHAPRPLDGEFTYLDLGCGNAGTLSALAESYADARFFGVDYGASHIADARALADEAGVSNLTLIQTDFADMNPGDFPDFDFIVLHGIYSWVKGPLRKTIRDFLQVKLKAGGAAYVSYNALPGWAALIPLRKAMITQTAPMKADPITSARAGVDYLNYLRVHKAAFFDDYPGAAQYLDEIADHDIHYVAHEFFAETHEPRYFADVAREMGGSGLQFAGNADVYMNFLDLAVPAEYQTLFRHIFTREQFETSGDFIRNQRFRKDVYVKGAPDLKAERQAELLAEIPFGSIASAATFGRDAPFPGLTLSYDAPAFEAVIGALDGGAKSVTQMKQLDGFGGFETEVLIDSVKFLSAGGQVLPFAKPTTAPDEAALNAPRYRLAGGYNLAILKRRLLEGSSIGLAAPAAGTGLEFSMADGLFALCHAEAPADQVADWAFQRLLEAGQQMIADGPDEGAAIAEAVRTFRDTRLAKFIELGILTPSEN